MLCLMGGQYESAVEGSGVCGDYGECVPDPEDPSSQLGVCSCEEHVFGGECQLDIRYCYGVFYLDEDVCYGHGNCVFNEVSAFVCRCHDGYDGWNCREAECALSGGLICSGHGSCIKDDTCRCDPGYRGADCSEICDCFGLPSDDVNVCSGHGECVAGDVCECDPGFSGENCLGYCE